MARLKGQWLYLLGAVVVFILMAPSMEAQCARCCQPPGEGWSCCHTFYNAGNGCEHNLGAGICEELGECQGDLGECEGTCVQEKWACGRPLGDEWRLERYTVEFPGTRPMALAEKERKGKA